MSTRHKNESVRTGGGSGVGIGLAIVGWLWAGYATANAEPTSLVMTQDQPVVIEAPGPAITLNDQVVIGKTHETVVTVSEPGVVADHTDPVPVDAPTGAEVAAKAQPPETTVYTVATAADSQGYDAAVGGMHPVSTPASGSGKALAAARVEKDGPAVPYALVLALIALIGLVPVSRRNNY